MDRTLEFTNTCNTLSKHATIAQTKLTTIANVRDLRRHVEGDDIDPIWLASKEISSMVTDNAKRLILLRGLAQRRGVFVDPGVEVNRAAEVVSKNLQMIAEKLRKFEKEVVPTANSTYTSESKQRPSTGVTHWNTVASIFQESQKHLLQSLHMILQERNRSLLDLAQQEKRVSRPWEQHKVMNNSPLFSMHPFKPPSMQQTPNASPSAAPLNNNRPAISSEASTGARALPYRRQGGRSTDPFVPTQSSTQFASGTPPQSNLGFIPLAQQLQAQTEPDTRYAETVLSSMPTAGSSTSQQLIRRVNDARARAQDIQAVESTISDVGRMMNTIAQLVSDQGETLLSIDTDLYEVEENVEVGLSELNKFSQRLDKNRGFILKLFGCIVLIILLFVFFK